MKIYNKSELLFELRNVIHLISVDDLQEIFQNLVSYKIHDDYLIEIKLIDNDINITINEYYSIEWFKVNTNIVHRENNKPSYINLDAIEYRSNDKLHRENGPAFVTKNKFYNYYDYYYSGKLIGQVVI